MLNELRRWTRIFATCSLATLWASSQCLAVLAQTGHSLYLISASPTDAIPLTNGASLLRIDADFKVSLAGTLTGRTDSVISVTVCRDAVFVLSEDNIFIIHKDALPRITSYNFDLSDADPFAIGCIDLIGQASQLLLPFGDGINSNELNLISSGKGEQRMSHADWSLYRQITIEGESGGPVDSGYLRGTRGDNRNGLSEKMKMNYGIWGNNVNETVGVFSGNYYAPVLTVPHEYLRNLPMARYLFLAKNDLYTILAVDQLGTYGAGLETAEKNEEDVYIVNAQNAWRKTYLLGTCSRGRLFSHWLASTVAFYSPGFGGRPTPSGLRKGESSDTEQLYRIETAEDCRLPGILVLQDLQSNKIITIDSGREDSEIVLVDKETVFYRINDEIWTGVISGSKLANVKMLAKDSRLVQAHWAFLGGSQ